MRIDPIEFRNVMSQIATGVTVVTTVHGGELHGMTANSVTSVSLDPLLVLVCLMRGALTSLAIKDSERLAVIILGDHQEELSKRFSKAGEDHFAHLWRISDGVENAAEGYWSFDGKRLCLQATPRDAECDRKAREEVFGVHAGTRLDRPAPDVAALQT